MTFDFNTIMGIVGAIFGLSGIIFSIYFYIKGKKKKKLAFYSESTILISEKLNEYENLKISYNDENISSLTSTIVRIKNIGTDIVEPSDLIPSSPLIITTTEKFLFNDTSQYKFFKTNKKNGVSLNKIDDNSIQVIFEFLNPKDEISITVLHTGDITMNGELKTNPVKNYTAKKYENYEIKYNHDDDTYIPSSSLLVKFISLIMSIMMIIMLYTYILTDRISSDNMLIYSMMLFMMITQLMQTFQNHK